MAGGLGRNDPLSVGLRGAEGLGVRGRLGVFAQGFNINDPLRLWLDELVLFTSTFNLDLYRRFFLNETEIVLGVGPAAGGLGFDLIHDDSTTQESHFFGLGISGFVEGWHPLWRLERADIGLVGRGRLTLLTGDWADDTEFIIPDTTEDSVTVFELAWGFEMRRPFGQNLDRYWFANWMFEHQTHTSPWIGEFADTSVALTGINLNFGVAW
jgi:hypothetical protein